MKIGIITITEGGSRLAGLLAAGLAPDHAVAHYSLFSGRLPGATREEQSLAAAVQSLWPSYDSFIFVMAAGLVVRTIAPLLQDKKVDPGVVVADEKGAHAISLLSGHLGGGNQLARQVAAILCGQPVVTTASDVLGLTALDLWVRARELTPRDGQTLTRASALLVNRGRLKVYSEKPVADLPADLEATARAAEADLIVSSRTDWPAGQAVFHPRNLVLGIGCNRGVAAGRLAAVSEDLLGQQHLARAAVRNLATIDLKLNEEGLLAFARSWRLPIQFFSNRRLNTVPGITTSAAVLRTTGAQGVAEPAALLSAGAARLLVEKSKWQDITLAIAEADYT